jgi:SLA1 homology domain 1, SHD1
MVFIPVTFFLQKPYEAFTDLPPRMKKLIPLLVFFTITLSLGQGHKPRVWIDEHAREITATYIKVDDEFVHLKLANGKTVPFPIKKLSKEDQEYLSELEDGDTTEDSSPTGEKKEFNFGNPWPEKVAFRDDAEIVIVSEDPDKKEFIYQSRNYEYKCDVRLNKSLVKPFSELFEATYEYCRAVPLALDGSQKAAKKLPILLFETKESYIKAGGPPSSAGVYMPSRNTVMVPLESVGVKKLGSGYMVDRTKTNSTLSHELTHQLTPHIYYEAGSLGWFTEGLAEYISNTPYQNGTYRIKGNIDEIAASVTAYGKDNKGGQNLSNNINVGDLKTYMLQSYSSFTANSSKNYGVGQLITYYFIHMDGTGDRKRLVAFLKALRDEKVGQDAIDVLLDGRTYEELAQEITAKWKKERVTLNFGSSSKK